MGASILKTPFQAPQANAFCERLVESIRRECVDLLGEGHRSDGDRPRLRTGPRRLFTFRFGDAEPVFFYAPEKIQRVEERPTFVFVTMIECQLFNSLSNCFLCFFYLFA